MQGGVTSPTGPGRPRSLILLGFALVMAALPIVVLAVTAITRGDVDLNKHGRVPLPGSGTIELPEGKVGVAYEVETEVINDFNKPDFDLKATPVGGGDAIEEDFGIGWWRVVIDFSARKEVGEDFTRASMGSFEVPEAGRYEIEVDTDEFQSFPGFVGFGEDPGGLFGPLPTWLAITWTIVWLLAAAAFGVAAALRLLWREVRG